MKLSKKDEKAIAIAIYQVWQVIAYDAGPVEDKEEIVEVCIDADRLATYGFKAEDKLVQKYVDGMGYFEFLTAMAKVL